MAAPKHETHSPYFADKHGECVSCLGAAHAENSAHRDGISPLRWHESLLSALAASFLFREQTRPSRPLALLGTCEEKAAGQRISAPGDEWAYTESFLPFSSLARTSIPLRLRSGLIRWERWRRVWWQPVIGSFRCRGAVRLVRWPCPLAVCAAQRIQPRHGHRSFPLTLWRSWVWNGLPHRNHPVGAWMSGSCLGAIRPLDNELRHSSQRFTTRSPSLGMHPTLHASSSSPLTSVDSAEEKGYDSLPPLNESVAVHLCPPTAIGWKARLALGPSWCLRQVQVLVVPLA